MLVVNIIILTLSVETRSASRYRIALPRYIGETLFKFYNSDPPL